MLRKILYLLAALTVAAIAVCGLAPTFYYLLG